MCAFLDNIYRIHIIQIDGEEKTENVSVTPWSWTLGL